PRNILNDRITLQEVETETLLYDERSHKAWCLNRSSACIWRLCNGRNTVQQIATHASAELGSPVSEDLVLFTLTELRNQNLLQPDSFAPVPGGLTRREMMGRAGLAAAALLPVIAALAAPPAASAASGGVGTGGEDAVKNHPAR
ncbi:MAG: PqqD family protein, partial [Acidobacteriaceae bacterium]